MTRYKLHIAYDGTRYRGWQRQPEGKTVEGVLETAMEQILQAEVDLVGQGRTDSGVHAESQIAHVDLPESFDPGRLTYALTGVLPRDIAVWKMEEVEDDFHARFDALSRTYRYQVLRRPSPLHNRHSILMLDPLDLSRMKRCADHILGTHDFESFTRSAGEQPHARCTVLQSEFQQDEQMITYRISANRFVRHMVRRLVGTMLQVGQGKRSVESFQEMVDQPDRERSGHGAKARGLILERVEYEK